jgi:hypothetical protein
MSDRPKIIYVVAGDFIQYKEYVMNKSQNLDKETIIIARNNQELQIGDIVYKYLNSEMQLRGIKDPEGVFYGTYYKRPDICDIIQQISIRKHKNLMNFIPEKHREYIETFKPIENATYIDIPNNPPPARITGISISVTRRKDED